MTQLFMEAGCSDIWVISTIVGDLSLHSTIIYIIMTPTILNRLKECIMQVILKSDFRDNKLKIEHINYSTGKLKPKNIWVS